MELDLGLKLTRVADEFTSDFLIAKDHAVPMFVSRETDTMFFLTAHLKGYKRRNIKIDINEDGSLIGIGGEKQVQETVMVGWKVYKKEREMKGFKKVFRIPQGVILDKIKAKFNDDESTLSITMPKKVKGIRGSTAIEEVKDKPELVREGSGSLQIADEKSPKAETSNKGRIGEDEAADQMPGEAKPKEEKHQEKPVSVGEDEAADQTPGEAKPKEEKHQEKPVSVGEDEAADQTPGEAKPKEEKHQEKPVSVAPPIHGEVARVEAETSKEGEEKQESTDDVQGITEPGQHEEKDELDTYKQVLDERSDEDKVLEPSAIEPSEEAGPGTVEDDEERPREKRFKLCLPIVAGSTLLLTFVVFVFQMIRSKHQTSRRRD